MAPVGPKAEPKAPPTREKKPSDELFGPGEAETTRETVFATFLRDFDGVFVNLNLTGKYFARRTLPMTQSSVFQTWKALNRR